MNRKLIGAVGMLALVFASMVNPIQAGNMSGPIDVTYDLAPGSSHTYDVALFGGVPTFIAVSGDGRTDLDLYVYDEFGNLVAFDDDASDECRAIVTPAWNGPFRIVIVNRGRYFNRYTLSTS